MVGWGWGVGRVRWGGRGVRTKENSQTNVFFAGSLTQASSPRRWRTTSPRCSSALSDRPRTSRPTTLCATASRPPGPSASASAPLRWDADSQRTCSGMSVGLFELNSRTIALFAGCGGPRAGGKEAHQARPGEARCAPAQDQPVHEQQGTPDSAHERWPQRRSGGHPAPQRHGRRRVSKKNSSVKCRSCTVHAWHGCPTRWGAQAAHGAPRRSSPGGTQGGPRPARRRPGQNGVPTPTSRFPAETPSRVRPGSELVSHCERALDAWRRRKRHVPGVCPRSRRERSAPGRARWRGQAGWWGGRAVRRDGGISNATKPGAPRARHAPAPPYQLPVGGPGVVRECAAAAAEDGGILDPRRVPHSGARDRCRLVCLAAGRRCGERVGIGEPQRAVDQPEDDDEGDAHRAAITEREPRCRLGGRRRHRRLRLWLPRRRSCAGRSCVLGHCDRRSAGRRRGGGGGRGEIEGGGGRGRGSGHGRLGGCGSSGRLGHVRVEGLDLA